MESTSRAICSAVRLVVPLKTMCSAKCEMPFTSGSSWREPVRIHTPADTERICGITSLSTVSPLGSTVRRMLRSIEFVCGSWSWSPHLHRRT